MSPHEIIQCPHGFYHQEVLRALLEIVAEMVEIFETEANKEIMK
jgi:hypothetical protein